MKRIITLLIITTAFTLVFCQSKQQTPPPVADVPAPKAQEPIELVGYTTHRIKLPFEYVAKDEKGSSKHYKEAWLVKLELKNMPSYPAQRVDFAIGDYIIPEYGGWKGGIYFKVYDQQRFEKLNQQEIKIRMADSEEFTSTKRQFEFVIDKKQLVEDEQKVLGRP